jgi:hypothetical protein
LLFAATSGGPYVYVFGTSTWHSLIGAETPILDFNTVDNVGNNIIRFGTYGRGVWDFAIASAPLPAELMAFTARAMESTNKTKLNWTTASEYNVKEFVVEHSTNGLDYYPIETIPAKGTSSVQQTYQFIHNTPKPGKNYYRLLIRDTDGRTENSTIQVVNFEAIVPSFVVFPNVVQPNEQIHIQPQSQDPYTTALYNLQGQLMLHQQANGTSDVTLNLPKGIYVYRIFSGQMQSTGRIVVQ